MTEQLSNQDRTEHRQDQRRTTLKGGKIAFHDGRSTIDCTVRNLSSGGAKLKVASVLGIPNDFELLMADNVHQHCRVVWRKVNEVGVAFGAA